jgi:uncharacterized protein (DUF4415 family)
MMKEHYDFSGGKRGAVIPSSPNKVRITIRLDSEVVSWFKAQVYRSGGGNYQTLINDCLSRHIEQQQDPLEERIRRVIREELKAAS